MSPAAEILIVDDSRTQAMLLTHLLEQHGYVVRAATHGRDGLEAARERKPSLIISDVLMPEMNGYQMCRAIKQDPLLGDVPVILLTTLSEPQDVLRGLEANADYYINKPFEGNFLIAKVETLLAEPPERVNGDPEEKLEITLAGQKHAVTSDRRRMINLLLSTYENAVQQNRELVRAQYSERAAHEALKKAQSHLVQREKLAGLGQMVAGIAHEINNPLAFVVNNVAVLQRDLGAVRDLLRLYREADATVLRMQPELHQRINALAQRIDVDYTLENLLGLAVQSREGLNRIKQIISDLRNFARLDTADASMADINAGVRSTVNIIENHARQKQVTIEEHPGSLPMVSCHPAKINQVFMNLLTNAIDACRPGGKVIIGTAALEKEIAVEVRDDGAGIDPAIRERIFDPFFTTKAPGSGTGLGLSISYGIVREHGGRIEVSSEPSRGSAFTVYLPMCAPVSGDS